MRPEPSPEIVEYIRANRGTYTREAIDRELAEAGHSQEAIDAAWQSFPVEVVAAPPPRGVLNTVQFWLLFIGVACVALVFLPIASATAVSLFASAVSSSSGSIQPLPFFLVSLAPLVLGYLAIGIGGWFVRRRDRAAALGIFSGMVVAFVFTVIIAGSCVALFAQL